jgi:hypothetical protein
MPTVEAQVAHVHWAILSEIAGLGAELPDNPSSTMLDLLTDLEGSLQRSITGHPGYEATIQEINLISRQFKKDIRATRPACSGEECSVDAVDGQPRPGLGVLLKDGHSQVYLSDMRRHIERYVYSARSLVRQQLTRQLPYSRTPKPDTRFGSPQIDRTLHLDVDATLRQYAVGHQAGDRGCTAGIFGTYAHGGLPNAVK